MRSVAVCFLQTPCDTGVYWVCIMNSFEGMSSGSRVPPHERKVQDDVSHAQKGVSRPDEQLPQGRGQEGVATSERSERVLTGVDKVRQRIYEEGEIGAALKIASGVDEKHVEAIIRTLLDREFAHFQPNDVVFEIQKEVWRTRNKTLKFLLERVIQGTPLDTNLNGAIAHARRRLLQSSQSGDSGEDAGDSKKDNIVQFPSKEQQKQQG